MKCFFKLAGFTLSLFIFSILACKQESQPEAKIDRPEIKSIEVAISDTIFYTDEETGKENFKIKKKKEIIYTIPNQLPVIKSCGKLPTLQGRYQCSNKKLIEFITTNLKYPEAAFQNDIEGVSMVQFIINEKGVPKNEKIVKSIGYGTDEEVLRIIKKMRTEKLRWDPGIVKGEKVKVLQTLPVKFSIN